MSDLAPKLPPLLISKTRSYSYVMTYKNVWDAEKKRSRRSDSMKVGSLDEKTGLITFDEHFLQKHPELDGIKVFRRGTGRSAKYEFVKQDESDDEVFLSKARTIQKLHGGATWVLNQLIADSPLGRALNKVFPLRNHDRKLLSLAYFLVLNRDNAVYNYEEFAECTWLPFQKPLNSTQVNRLFSMITEDQIEKFFVYLDEEFSKFTEKEKDFSPVFLALDSTSLSTYSRNLSAAEFGHNKDGDELSQVNLLFLTEQSTGLPLFYRAYDGAVPDVSTLRNLIATRARLKLNDNVIFVSDKGYMSASNIEDCLRNNIHFIFNCKISGNGKTFVQSLIDEHLHDLINTNNKVRSLKQYVVSGEIDYRYDSFLVKDKRSIKKDTARLFYHVYYDDDIKKRAFDVLTDNLCLIREKYNSGETLSAFEQKYVDEYMDIDDGKATINMAKQNEHLKYSGIRVLLSDTVKCPLQAHQAYDDRNMVEYAFNTLKSRLKCNRLRCHNDNSLRGKIFVQVLACSIAIMLRNRIAQYNASNPAPNSRFSLIYDSDHKLLSKLNNVMVTRFNNGWYFDEVVGYKKDLFKAIGVDIPSVSAGNDDLVEDEEQSSTEDELTDKKLCGEIL